jgi:mono/diheme cytochrome c family protein
MFKRILIGAAVAILFGAAGFVGLAYSKRHPTAYAVTQNLHLNEGDASRAADHLDARLYLTACASCHYIGPGSYSDARPDLATDESVSGDDPTKLISIILNGRGSEMPAFAGALPDPQIAMLAAYLRATRTTKLPWADLEHHVGVIRAKGNPDLGAD